MSLINFPVWKIADMLKFNNSRRNFGSVAVSEVFYRLFFVKMLDSPE